MRPWGWTCATRTRSRGRVEGELIDRQAANGDVGARDGQSGGAARRRAAHRDQRRAGKARLSGTVDEHGGRDRRQGSDGFDGLDPGAGDGEIDRDRQAGHAIGVQDRLAERAGAAVGRRVDHEDAVRDRELRLEWRRAVGLGTDGEGGKDVRARQAG